jgi:hypothetical protein
MAKLFLDILNRRHIFSHILPETHRISEAPVPLLSREELGKLLAKTEKLKRRHLRVQPD